MGKSLCKLICHTYPQETIIVKDTTSLCHILTTLALLITDFKLDMLTNGKNNYYQSWFGLIKAIRHISEFGQMHGKHENAHKHIEISSNLNWWPFGRFRGITLIIILLFASLLALFERLENLHDCGQTVGNIVFLKWDDLAWLCSPDLHPSTWEEAISLLRLIWINIGIKSVTSGK